MSTHKPATNAFRLSKTVRPIHYELTIKPDFEAFTFAGEVDVELAVERGVRSIVLHCLEIRIQSAALVWTADGREHRMEAAEIVYDAGSQTAAIKFEKTPAGATGNPHLRLVYRGELNDKLRGFYRSRYVNPEGETSWLACTQFEPVDARRALPCFDEPALKATFKVTLNVPRGMAAVSNMPVAAKRDLGSAVQSIEFETTPVMSTYLLAFIVGDLAHIEKAAADGKPVRVWTTRGKERQGRFTLDTSIKLLSFYHDYFGIKYPLPKLDHVALPDFSAGAMENFGCITYRETAVLLDEDNSSADTRKRIAVVVAHELAHLWFGDLATMRWWDDLWLNESFATWAATKALHWLFPEWSMWTDFVSTETQRAFALDGLTNSHPIHQEVQEVSEVGQLFDAISYSKGGAVLRMLEQHLTPEAFRKGLSLYLERHAYGNASTIDLWQALEDASKTPVVQLMGRWTGQTGYPVLDVRALTDGNGLSLEIQQRRFVYESILADTPTVEDAIWPVPLTVTAAGSPATAMLFDARSATVALSAPPGQPDWIKLNPDQTGFYRVNYSERDWERLMPAIRSMELPATDRLGLQSDAYALSRAGLLSVARFLSVAESYIDETDSSVWSSLAANLREIEATIADEPCLGAFRAFGRRLFAAAARRSGWQARPGEGHLGALLRATVLREAGGYGDTEVIAQAQALFEAHQSGATKVHPDLRGIVYGTTAQEGGRELYERLWELERAADLHEEKTRLLLAMARFRDEGLLRETLERSLAGDEVRSQDTVLVVSAVAANVRGRSLAWDFVKENWTEFDRRYGDGGFDMMRLVGIVDGFSTEGRHDEVADFFAGHTTSSADRAIRQALERIRLNAAWLKSNREALRQYFEMSAHDSSGHSNSP